MSRNLVIGQSEMNFFFIYWVQCMIVRRAMSSKLILYLYPLIGLHIWATWSPMSFLDYLVGWSDTDKRLVSEKLLPSFRMVFR